MERVEVTSESNTDVVVTVKFPQLHYLNQFIRLRCAPMILGLFPNVKEITETMTAYNAIRRYLGIKSFGEDITLLDIACGHTPRTASLFAYMTRWNCIAIDPVLHDKTNDTKRLILFPEKLEEFELFEEGLVVVVAVHAHIDLNLVLKNVHAPRVVIVAMPCCKPLQLTDHEPVEEFEDHGCLSPRRTVRLYDIGA